MKKININMAKPTDDPGSYNLRAVGFIKRIVSDYYKLPYEVYLDKGRTREIINVKHSAIYFCVKNLKVTKEWLGSQFGMDHATIIHATKKIDGLLSWDKILSKEFEDIQNIISFKGLAEAKGVDLHKEYYYIDLNNIISVKVEANKSIVFSGWSSDEVKKFMTELFLNGSGTIEPEPPKKHINTGLYIMEKYQPKKPNKSKNE